MKRRRAASGGTDQGAPGTPTDGGQRMPVEELSRRTGVTVRNLRELQTRGLLAPPELLGRKGLYTEQHVARVLLVRRLQERGYSLLAIADLLQRWHGKLGALGVLEVEESLAETGAAFQRALDEREVLALFPELRSDPQLRKAAEEAEVVVEREGALIAPSAELLELGRIFADAGVPPVPLLAELKGMRQDAARTATRFRDLFQAHVVAAVQRAGMTAEGIQAIAQVVARLRPAAVRATAIVLAQELQRGVSLSQPPRATPPRKRTKARAK